MVAFTSLVLSLVLCYSRASSTDGNIAEETLIDGLARVQELTSHQEATTSSLSSIAQKIEEAKDISQRLLAKREVLEQRQRDLARVVSLANAKQLESLVDRLQTNLAEETGRRNSEAEAQSEEPAAVAESSEESQVDYVNIHDVKNRFETNSFLRDSEDELKEWALRIVTEELKAYKDNLMSEHEARNEVGEKESTGSCPSVTDIVQDVQVALSAFAQDGIGLVDHSQSAEIVHSMTSRTYEPPPGEGELFGNVWWRKYIPQDWERLMPDGWEDWSMVVPSSIYHSLNLKGSRSAPPETIVQKNTLPGACWPMEGTSGQVTMRLPYPVQVESFSVDHVSWQIVADGMDLAAPKTMKVIAYPPCEDANACGALGFDASDPMEVAHIAYDIEGPSIQTFNSVFVDENKVDEEEDAASCSEQGACTAPPQIDVAAITVKVVENHGDPDYTCLYRFRVHGEQVAA